MLMTITTGYQLCNKEFSSDPLLRENKIAVDSMQFRSLLANRQVLTNSKYIIP